MVVFLLLVIIAILLFGSSAVTGAIGAVLGLIAASIALIYASTVLGVSPANLLIGVIATIAILSFFVWIYDQSEKNAQKKPEESATILGNPYLDYLFIGMHDQDRKKFNRLVMQHTSKDIINYVELVRNDEWVKEMKVKYRLT